MYLCVCNAITEKMLKENSFLLQVIGTKCGKCLESGHVNDGAGMTYLVTQSSESKTATYCYDSDGTTLIIKGK